MKTIRYYLLLAAVMTLVSLASCVGNEFSIAFRFPKEHVGNYIINYYAWDSRKGSWIENVASVQNGVAEVHASTVRPTIVYIRDASSPGNSLALFVERGDEIVISGDGPDMNTWSVEGNDRSELWSEWRRSNASVLSAAGGSMTPGKKKALGEFVKANSDDRIAAIVLLSEWNRNDDPEGFLRLWNSIDKDARSQETIGMCGASDLLGVQFTVGADGNLELAAAARLNDLPLRSRDNGMDTLRFGSHRPALLFFYADNNMERRQVIDSLRAVGREYPDSARRIIGVVSLHPDSMAWINSTRTDTVKGLVRSWVPRGLADPAMVELGVSRIPWFVVVGADSRKAYSGPDPAQALQAFRSALTP